ncbi:MAG: GNAT family N-acetyltransferase, partial [bacterium]|nr:GNAT family N-acetyltransferase [bacterium]
MDNIYLPDQRIVSIRKATIADASALVSYMHAISAESEFLSFGAGEFDKTIEDECQTIINWGKRDNCLYLVALLEGEIVGHLTYAGGTRKRTHHTGEFGIAVQHDFWGLGIGKALMSILICWANANPIIGKINLRVRDTNYKAIAIYERLGFQHEGRIT